MKESTTSGLRKFFFGLIILISAVTTAAFFWQHFIIFPGLPAVYNGILGAIIGVTVLDGGALAWLRIYLSGSDNNDERSIAVVSFFVDMAGSAITTFVTLFFASNLMTPPAGLGTGATIAIAAVTVFNFVMAAVFTYKSTRSQIDEKVSEMKARATKQMLGDLETELMARIPGMAERQALALADEVQAQFDQIGLKAAKEDFEDEDDEPGYFHSQGPIISNYDTDRLIGAVIGRLQTHSGERGVEQDNRGRPLNDHETTLNGQVID
jgi:hypothetical protein